MHPGETYSRVRDCESGVGVLPALGPTRSHTGLSMGLLNGVAEPLNILSRSVLELVLQQLSVLFPPEMPAGSVPFALAPDTLSSPA